MEKDECCSKWRGRGWGLWKWIGFSILGIIGFFAFAILFGVVIMWLWNCLMPALFHFPIITFWEAVGLAVLARLLFGGFRHGGHSGCRGRKFHHGNWGRGHNCGRGWDKWNYYEEYWKDEGEASFNEYVKRKSENTDKS